MADVFTSHLTWSGAAKGPTADPASFSRDLEVSFDGAPAISMSAAPGYKGDPSRLNPEQLLVASLSTCQALTYLFLAARNGVRVVAYADEAEGRLALVDGRIRMSQVTLRPAVTLEAGAEEAKARQLVDRAHEQCFISNSITSKIVIEPTFTYR